MDKLNQDIPVKNYSNKIILYLNFKNEFLGDVYKNFNGIEYIDNENKFIKILNLIKDNNFFPKNKINNYKSSNINEALEYIYKCSSKNL